ncbi:hypothetical protein LOTGIDRAFT_230443 [Lottia gigantea]|uniref:VWFD domain-containing protein n=1 Tax=Lottia gigantea TaxID=225164 RepID=V4AG22_LOTGI|nr:hypothetical protein LOTGIDRAFT_230443 [Lottia gigantea]ESP02989.1 hypothetical protein LOTGIDRAFT_230443 [Lottia gigantea]
MPISQSVGESILRVVIFCHIAQIKYPVESVETLYFWKIFVWTESPYRAGNCSEAFVICDGLAECVETKSNYSFQCICGEGSMGDGFKSGTGCFFENEPCTKKEDCHKDAYCDLGGENICKCNEYYVGNGKDICLDIDECKSSPCAPEGGNCQNQIGGLPTCSCDIGYEGDGLTCTRICLFDDDCFSLASCVNKDCKCNSGYEGNGFISCTDINECEVNPGICTAPAVCKNTQGGHTCGCPNGYSGNVGKCTLLPKDCQEIFENDMTAKSGDYFEIDTDGADPIDSMMVKCEFRDDVGITIMEPNTIKPSTVGSTEISISYKPGTIEQVKDLVSKSAFCYQSQWLECSNGFDLFKDGLFYWTDGAGNSYKTWGGSGEDGQCPCGVLGYCEQGVPCNCDGTSTTTGHDFGKIINGSMLPIATLQFNTASNGAAKYKVSEVVCASKIIDILKDCDQIKMDGFEENGPQYIDIDGPTGDLQPTLVHCDMTQYDHVGLTVMPHDIKEPIIPDSGGPIDLTYLTPDDVIQAIIQASAFCFQNIRYECRNAPITFEGEQRVYVKAGGGNGTQLNYFPGGKQREGYCGCGVTCSCVNTNYTCNCDITDNVTRYDIANHTIKEDLPIKSFYVNLSLPDSYSRIIVGPLLCSEQQFGIEPNCEKYRNIGVEDPYTYLIDPDGPKDPEKPTEINYEPFEVECQFNANPPQGVTIVHHDQEGPRDVTSDDFQFEMVYKNVDKKGQIAHLKDRSTFCGQSLDFACTNTKLHNGPEEGVTWKDIDSNSHSYLSGGEAGDTGCRCNVENNLNCAEGDKICNCDADAGGNYNDDGELGNITHLPVSSLDFMDIRNDIGSLQFTLGPLKCFETFTTCYDMEKFLKEQKKLGEAKLENGKYTIDPDRSGDNPPFTVTCEFPFTVVSTGPANLTGPDPGSTECYTVEYFDFDGNALTGSQVAYLVSDSDYCTQKLEYECKNAPLTGNVNYTTCDGRPQTGWALSSGYDMCSCGLTGTCVGGLNEKCNCDTVNGEKDEGTIYNSTRLPVCEVCITVDPLGGNNPPSPGGVRSASYDVGMLKCSGAGFVGEAHCQDLRVTSTTSGVSYIGDKEAGSVVPVYCDMISEPRIGIMEFRLNETTYTIPATQGIDISPVYFGYGKEDMERLINDSYYCTQEIFIDCNSGALDLSGINGWYSRAGDPQDSWGGNIGKTLKCEGTGSNCNCNKAGAQTDGGILGDKALLPISRVVLEPHSSERILRIEPVKCYELRPDCYQIMMSGNTKTPYSEDRYVIDPDGPDGVDPFVVTCSFNSEEDNAITEVPVDSGANNPITGKVADFGFPVPITYKDATPEQINVLANQSPFCHQGVEYECTKTPINGSVDYRLYDNTIATGFGTGYDTNSSVCPCYALGYCDGFACRCDEKLSSKQRDGGEITDKNNLPITVVNVGGQVEAGASANVKVDSVRCEKRPIDLPENCEEAKVKGYKTGEVMIYPSSSLDPFFVYCDMEINPGRGTAVVLPDIEPDQPVAYDGVAVNVTYKGLTDAQLQALVSNSYRCYQPVRYNCRKTNFVGGDKFSWTSVDASVNKYFGAGSTGECTCGKENKCAGSGDKSEMEARDCNCDMGDDEDRIDAGILSVKEDLPLRSYTFLPTGLDGSSGNITIGPLYCGQNTINLDECEQGFHDCHPLATCSNLHAGYSNPSSRPGFKCSCTAGNRGIAKPQLFVNGRQCFGDFLCTCNKGYEKMEKTVCRNIDECVEVQYPNNCDLNAKCFDTEGSFYCKCKRGFRGEGTNGTCEGVGICACFGDPHCISFDNKWLDFMGDCQYVMAQDGCDGSERTFAVWTHNWDMNRDIQGITWVKDVTVVIGDTKIFLGPDRVIRINGREFLGYRKDGISVDDNGREVVITADFGLEVAWDGGDEVEIFLDKSYVGKTCGICGDFDSDEDNDWRIGDYCTAAKGQITPNGNIFGHSWVVQDYLTEHPTCVADCNAAPTDYSGCSDTLYNYYCDRVFDPEISPFKTCLEVMDEPLRDRLKSTCLFDICQVSNDIELGMCASAERLVNECNKNLDTETGLWRKLGFCEIQCGKNQEYRTCGPRGYPAKTRQPLCYDIRTHSPIHLLEYCAEGCYCLPGYILEGKDCVLPSECGCIADGVYLSVGQTFINDDCTSTRKCLSGGNTSDITIACSQFATCGLDTVNAVFGCNCNDGYKGDGINCGEDNCYNVTCGKNMECENAICQCKKGYTGDCNNCEDIDECATQTHDCIHIGQNCTNKDGGYECACIKGYVPYGHYCLDIDECEAGFDNCGDHSECVNTHGSFECSCCAGYKKSGDNCVLDGTSATNGAKCCSCAGEGCSTDVKVCAENGTTYPHEKALRIASCRNDFFVDISYYGQCQADCTGVICEKPYEVCSIDPLYNKAICACPKCDGSGGPVCSSRLVLFDSRCEFERIMCEIKDNTTYIEEDVTLCDKVLGEPVSPWTAWSDCSVDCGAGEMTRTRVQLRARTTYELRVLPLLETAICYGNCTNGPCFGFNCTVYGEVCVPTVDNTPECICPNCTFREDDPICGLVGDKQSTFKNRCELQKKACEVNQKPHVLSESPCGALPLNCSMFSKYQDLSDGECFSGPVPIGTCEGGCGINPDYCCETQTMGVVEYDLLCNNGSTLHRQVPSITSCSCNDLGHTTPA